MTRKAERTRRTLEWAAIVGAGLAAAAWLHGFAGAAALTAGVSTTAVASLDMNAVTTTPIPYTSTSRRRGDPPARRTASPARWSNRPSRSASSETSIIPAMNR